MSAVFALIWVEEYSGIRIRDYLLLTVIPPRLHVHGHVFSPCPLCYITRNKPFILLVRDSLTSVHMLPSENDYLPLQPCHDSGFSRRLHRITPAVSHLRLYFRCVITERSSRCTFNYSAPGGFIRISQVVYFYFIIYF